MAILINKLHGFRIISLFIVFKGFLCYLCGTEIVCNHWSGSYVDGIYSTMILYNLENDQIIKRFNKKEYFYNLPNTELSHELIAINKTKIIVNNPHYPIAHLLDF